MTKANEMAFPDPIRGTEISKDNPSARLHGPGLNKREYFAAMAMQGLLASWGNHDVTDAEDIAHDAVQAADALIEELNKQS